MRISSYIGIVILVLNTGSIKLLFWFDLEMKEILCPSMERIGVSNSNSMKIDSTSSVAECENSFSERVRFKVWPETCVMEENEEPVMIERSELIYTREFVENEQFLSEI
jgi:hypothetical protein